MITYRDFVAAFRRLGLGESSRILAHASLSAFGEVAGGAETVVGAMVGTFDSVMMPAFTLRTMVVPSVGPSNNAITYDHEPGQNELAEFFQPEMAADRSVGVVSETLRKHPEASRSHHPILSFTGVNSASFLEAQSLEDPLALVGRLADADGDVLLLGVDHRADAAIHYAEQQARRHQFTRWALTPRGVVECPNFPGCSDGFMQVQDRLSGIRRHTELGSARLESVPLRDLIHLTSAWIRQEPLALLCDRPSCPRCSAVRAVVEVY
ncbi:MAG: AAC(3) family N-acetyltransferase [Anaerolineales bacterium]